MSSRQVEQGIYWLSELFDRIAKHIFRHKRRWLAFLFLIAIVQSIRQAMVVTNSDVYFTAASRLLRHEPIYQVADDNPFKYFPSIGLLFLPLGFVTLPVANAIWCFAMFLATWGICWFAYKSLQIAYPQNPNARALVFFGLLACESVYALHYAYGQAHILMVLWVFMALYFHLQKKYLLAGLGMALAISMKIVPALFLGYYVLKKDWRMLGASLLGMALLSLLVCIAFGFPEGIQMHIDYWNLLHARNEHNMWDPYVYFGNQNVQSIFTSYFTETPIVIKGISKQIAYIPLPYLKIACGIFTGALSIWILKIFLRTGKPTPSQLFIEYNLISFLMTLYSPLAWRYTYVALIGFYIVCMQFFSEEMFRDGRKTGSVPLIGILLFILNQFFMDCTHFVPMAYNDFTYSFNLVAISVLGLFFWVLRAYELQNRP